MEPAEIKYVPGSAAGLAPGNRTEGSTGLCNIVSPELPSIPFPVANPVAKLGRRFNRVFKGSSIQLKNLKLS